MKKKLYYTTEGGESSVQYIDEAIWRCVCYYYRSSFPETQSLSLSSALYLVFP